MYCGDGLLSNCKVRYATKTVKGHLWIFMCSEPLNLNWSFLSSVAGIVFTLNGKRNFMKLENRQNYPVLNGRWTVHKCTCRFPPIL